MKVKQDKQVNIWLPQDVVNILDEQANYIGLSRSAYLRGIIMRLMSVQKVENQICVRNK